ncbi:MAG: NAD(P)H-dependent oxidoreductase [Alphaproteobacteria bacterium]
MKKPLIIGLSASLRNARSSRSSRNLSDEIAELENREQLDAYLSDQANIHLDQFKRAGRDDGKPFDELYRNLKREGGTRGLSNSEIALAAALWAAQQNGVDISHIPLPDHFPASGVPQNLDQLKAQLRKADGILLSTPVYFGDRGSLAQQFVEMIYQDPELKADLEGKLYAGIAVGAKRNGGQETTLIYALMDMLRLGFLGVGNDSDTTSQYGGTGHAGDIGTMPKDTYGLETSMGTGRRIANVALRLAAADSVELDDKVRLDFWPLQDRKGEARLLAAELVKGTQNKAQSRFVDLLKHAIRPCIACDICPTHIGPDEEYRCIIRSRNDGLVEEHSNLIWGDVLIPTVLSPRSWESMDSVYQQFMERTRYLRRGDYVFTDRLVAPFIVAEVGESENMNIRLVTSFVRHHTVLSRPIVAYMHNGELLNKDEVEAEMDRAVKLGTRLAAGRLVSASLDLASTQYRPVGYVLATAKDKEKKAFAAREDAVYNRLTKQNAEASVRLKSLGNPRAIKGVG